jgi:hypothetical protein
LQLLNSTPSMYQSICAMVSSAPHRRRDVLVDVEKVFGIVGRPYGRESLAVGA